MQVIQDFGVNGLFPATIGGTGTSIKYFGRNVPNAGGATWVPAPSTPSASNATGAMIVPGDNKVNNQKMFVRATGSFTPGSAAGSETVTLVLQAVTGTLASPTYTTLATSTAFAPTVDGIGYNFAITAELFGGNDSGIVGGTQKVLINNTVNTSEAALTNQLTGIVFGQVGSGSNQLPGSLGGPFGLVVGVTFSVSNAANLAKLYQFSIEA